MAEVYVRSRRPQLRAAIQTAYDESALVRLVASPVPHLLRPFPGVWPQLIFASSSSTMINAVMRDAAVFDALLRESAQSAAYVTVAAELDRERLRVAAALPT